MYWLPPIGRLAPDNPVQKHAWVQSCKRPTSKKRKSFLSEVSCVQADESPTKTFPHHFHCTKKHITDQPKHEIVQLNLPLGW